MGRLLYTVWYKVDQNIEDEWNFWMESEHIPKVMKVGNFLGAKRYRIKEGSNFNYVTLYEAKDLDSLRNYLSGPGILMRKEYQEKFGYSTKVERIVLEQI